MISAEAWLPVIKGFDAVINAAGLLQDGPGEDVTKVQSVAMKALFAACEQRGVRRLVQISAVGASANAATAFMRSKYEADAALRASSLDWVILRPGLVIGAAAYGGTSMLRGLAALPCVIPTPRDTPLLQTVALDEVADAALRAVEGRLPLRHTYDLVESSGHSLGAIAKAWRAALGFAPAPVVALPLPLFRLIFRLGDLAGWLGWHSPMRSTALRQIEAGIAGDAAVWIEATGRPLKALGETLADMPASVQERWFAQLFLLKPLVIVTLSLFWLASGLVGLVEFEAARSVLVARGQDATFAGFAVILGALVDIALGAGMAFRRTMPVAAIGMIAVTGFYLAAGTAMTPDLWVDPLGPFVKTIPAAMLALVALAIKDGR
jgi:uncharacterized protein YbjT (DUF2867 family)